MWLWIVVSLALAVAVQAVMPFSARLYDGPFHAAHLLKIASYAAVLGGLSLGMFRLFQEVEEQAKRLEARAAELAEEVRQHRETEDQLRDTIEEIEAFKYSVSHDLRSRLRAMAGFSQALVEEYGGVLDETAGDYLRRIRASSQRMGQLIDDLLGFSRLSRKEMRVGEVDLTAAAQEILDELAQGDPELVRILLRNLLENAWKFTRDQERPRIEVGAIEEDGRRTFYVRDNGAGFDMAYADKLFGAFQRLHREDEFPGTGIGLATAQRVARRHGGSLRGEGKVGEGAVFRFTLGDA